MARGDARNPVGLLVGVEPSCRRNERARDHDILAGSDQSDADLAWRGPDAAVDRGRLFERVAWR
jgi:hypothetical protein